MNQSVTTYFRHPQIRDCHRFVILQDYLTHEKHYLEAVWSSSSTITNQPGPYFARVRFGGKLYRHALGTSDYKLARRKLADFRNGLERTDATKGKTSLAKMLDARRSRRCLPERLPTLHCRIRRSAKRVFGVGSDATVITAPSSSSDFFLRSIGNLPRQMTANLSKADTVEDTSGLGVGCLPPRQRLPLFQTFRSRG